MVKEYIFCPWCGGITYPGICTNCGCDTSMQNVEGMNPATPSEASGVTPNAQPNINRKKQPIRKGQGSPMTKKEGGKLPIILLSVFAAIFSVLIIIIMVAAVGINVYSISQDQLAKAKENYRSLNTPLSSDFWDLYYYDTYVDPYSSVLPNDDYGQDSLVIINNEICVTVDNEEPFLFENYDGISIFQDVDMEFFSSNEVPYYAICGHGDDFEYDYTKQECYPLYADNITETESYQLRCDVISYESLQTYDTAVCVYYQIESDVVPNVDSLNTALKEISTKRLQYYFENQNSFTDYFEVTDSYVAYNDENILSIIYIISYSDEQGISQRGIQSVNINMEVGEIIEDGNIVNFSDELIEEVLSLSVVQNDNLDIINAIREQGNARELFTNPLSNFVFYTPMGLEIGCNISYLDGYATGWLSSTLISYERYLSDPQFDLDHNMAVQESAGIIEGEQGNPAGGVETDNNQGTDTGDSSEETTGEGTGENADDNASDEDTVEDEENEESM